MTAELQFLKLGGSLITDKTRPYTPRPQVLTRLAGEIAAWRAAHPGAGLLLGHGSGSFGHAPAVQYGTRQGVHSATDWGGFVAVWQAAAALNRLVMAALAAAGIPALAFPPSASVWAEQGQVRAWELAPLRAALAAGLLPVVYGDVVFDQGRGGTILSTEDLFAHLAGELRPRRILLAGREPGVWADFPARTRLLPDLTPRQARDLGAGVGGSSAQDVTGGMAAKVAAGLALVQAAPGLEVVIFSGETPGALAAALEGQTVGTRLRPD